jgi:hypothetical protein
MSRVTLQLEVDAQGAIRSIQSTSGEMKTLGRTTELTQGGFVQFGRVVEVAMGVALQRLLAAAVSRIRDMRREFMNLSQEIQDVDSRFGATFRNVRDEADDFINRFRELTGFTTTQSRRMASEIAEIALSLGESDKSALQLAESSAFLALQWERIAGMDFAQGQRTIALALTGNIAQLQRMGIISREITRTHFDQLTMKQRLDAVTEGLTRRYGDLTQAGDGLTQTNRQINGRLREQWELMVRQLTPALNNILTSIEGWISNNQELIGVLGMLVGETLIDLANMLGTLSGRTRTLEDDTGRLTGIIGKLIEAKFAWHRATLGLAMGVVRLEIMWSRLARTLGKLTGTADLWTEKLRDQEDMLKILGLRANEMLIDQQKTRDGIRAEREARDELSKSNLNYGITADTVRRSTVELTNITQELIDKLLNIPDVADDIEVSLEHILDPIRLAHTLISRFGEDGRVALEDIDAVLRGLNDELNRTTDPDRRQALVEMAERLNDIRLSALGAKDATEEWTRVLQTSFAGAISQALIQMTDLFEGIGAGSKISAREVLQSLLQIVRGIGQQLIAWGTAQLIMTAGVDPRGWSAIAYGTTLATLSSLAGGSLSRGAGTSGGAGGGSPRSGATRSSPASTTASMQTRQAGGIVDTGLASLNDKFDRGLNIYVYADLNGVIEGEDIHLSTQRVQRLHRRIGNE